MQERLRKEDCLRNIRKNETTYTPTNADKKFAREIREKREKEMKLRMK